MPSGKTSSSIHHLAGPPHQCSDRTFHDGSRRDVVESREAMHSGVDRFMDLDFQPHGARRAGMRCCLQAPVQGGAKGCCVPLLSGPSLLEQPLADRVQDFPDRHSCLRGLTTRRRLSRARAHKASKHEFDEVVPEAEHFAAAEQEHPGAATRAGMTLLWHAANEWPKTNVLNRLSAERLAAHLQSAVSGA